MWKQFIYYPIRLYSLKWQNAVEETQRPAIVSVAAGGLAGFKVLQNLSYSSEVSVIFSINELSFL
jgi:hypothetical protein